MGKQRPLCYDPSMKHLLWFALAACGSHTPDTIPPALAHASRVTNTSLAAVGLDAAALDRSADPCDDFYQFACGNWIATTQIPADKSEAMRSFVAIADRNFDYERIVLERARSTPDDDPILHQLGVYYGSCMDEAAINRVGIRAIRPLLASVDAIRDAKSLSAAVATLHAYGLSALFALDAVQDSADARNVIAEIDQAGIGLPDRDYYLNDDAQFQAIRATYKTHVATMLIDAGRRPDAAAKASQAILALETAIAKVSIDKVARRDPKRTYNKIDRTGVDKVMSHFDWNAFWTRLGFDDVKAITVTSPEFLAGIDALLVAVPASVWRDYLTAYVVRSTAAYTSTTIEDQQFAFSSTLTGTEQQEPRWKRCTRRTQHALGDLLGQVFVRDRFAGSSKTGAEQQVRAIVSAMASSLAALPWMDATTKANARAKLAAMTYQIGFPAKWRSYRFALDEKTWGANALAADAAEQARRLAKIGKPVDRDDWEMPAPMVNAYYDSQLNGMVFPAGILQPPFFNVDASLAVNLGGIGVVVGHELTHGFDDQGAQFDAAGNLKDWWQPETHREFVQRTQCVIDQYAQYQISDGTTVDGAHTVGENIADIGGVKLAFAAFRSLRQSAATRLVAGGFTEDQQFFLGFGQAWCAKQRPNLEKLRATVDEHSPPRWRVNGALAATPQFASAFGCKPGSKLRPAKPCVVW